MANPLAPSPVPGPTSFALLCLRVCVGVALVMHGWGKIGHLTTWMNDFQMRDAAPPILQAIAVVSEVGGGAAIALGFLTRLAALGVLCTMGYAAFWHWSGGDAFVASGGKPSFELPLTYALVGLLLLLTGPGSISADQVMFKRSAH
jgi:putative oxidoreductase